MSVQRYSAYHSGDPHKVGLWGDPEGYWVTFADHARIVAEMEQAHAAALAERTTANCDERSCAVAAAAAPRTLTADDPEPSVGSVVLDQTGYAWQRIADYWWSGDAHRSWNALVSGRGPVTLIWDGDTDAPVR